MREAIEEERREREKRGGEDENNDHKEEKREDEVNIAHNNRSNWKEVKQAIDSLKNQRGRTGWNNRRYIGETSEGIRKTVCCENWRMEEAREWM
jgi:hypothetical protein